jgi:hypothetical protein
MAAAFIISGLLIGCPTLIAALLCCNIVYHSWKFHFSIKENYSAKFGTYRKKLDPFKPTKIIGFLGGNDSAFIQITNMLEKRTRIFLHLFATCFPLIALITASGFLLHIFNKI